MNNVILKVEGMHCTGCASRIETLLQRNDGVKRASAHFDRGEARVLYDPQVVTEDQLAAAIDSAGYRVTERSAS